MAIVRLTAPRIPTSGPGIGGRSIKAERAEFNLTTSLSVGDRIELFRLHPQFRVTDGWIKTDGMGAGVTIDVGDDDPDRYFSGASVSAAGVTRISSPAGVDHVTGGAYTTVFATIAGAATAASGSLEVSLFGHIHEPGGAMSGTVAPGPSPEPEPEPEIELLSIDSRGMSGQAVEPLDGPIIFPEPLAVPILRKGFDETGAPVLHVDTIYAVARSREPYPASTQNHIEPTTNGVVFSENVTAGDLIMGVTNNSTLQWPKLSAVWTRRDFRVVGDSLQVGMSVIGHNSRNGKLAACVVYDVTDGTTTISSTVTQPAPFIQRGTGYCVIEWGHTFDTSGFPDGAALTVNARVYPWYGDATAVFDTRDFMAEWDTIAQTYWKHSGIAASPVYGYIDPAEGNNATGVVSADPAVARASPFKTVTEVGVGNALKALNNSLYGQNNCRGAVIRIMGDAPLAGFAGAEGLTVEADPVNYPGDDDFVEMALSANVSLHRTLYRTMRITRTTTATFGNMVYFEDVRINAATATSASKFLASNGKAKFWQNVTVEADGELRNYFMPQGTAGGNALIHIQDTVILATYGNVFPIAVLGSRLEGAWTLLGNASTLGGAHGVHVEAVIQYKAGGVGARNYGGGSLTTRPTMELNYMVEGVSSNDQNFMGISGDGQPQSVYGYKGWYRTTAGWDTQHRENNAYDDSAGPRTHPWFSISKSIIVRTATKGDRFSNVQDGTRQGSWWWEYQVGGNSNVVQFGLEFPLSYRGLNSKGTTVMNVPLEMDWAHYQAATDGVVGAGFGDYHMGPASVAADMDMIPAVGWDIEGNPRVAGGPIGVYGVLAE